MAGWWKNLKLQAKFALIIGAGILTLAASTVTVFGYLEYSNIEQKLRTFSERELNSLNSLVDSAMRMRLDDQKNVAIKVFDGWFESRNKEFDGKLWSVWSQSTAAYMKRTAPAHPAKVALDAVDEEALRTGQPVGRFVNDTYRYSLPIVQGSSLVTKQEICITCHVSGMGTKNGEVIAVFSSSVPTTKDFALLRQHILLLAAGALAGLLLMLFAIWSIFGRVVAQPIRKIATVLTELTNDRIVDVPFTQRGDEIGDIAKATEVFKQSIAEKVINLRVRAGLDVVRSNVMVADDDYNIMYMNTTLQEMMREAEAELRKVLPAFDASKLLGANMDVFHKNPAHQRKMLDALTRHPRVPHHGRQPEIPPGGHPGHRPARQARRHRRGMAERDGREGDRRRGRRPGPGRGRRRLLQARAARGQEGLHAQSRQCDEFAVRQHRQGARRPRRDDGLARRRRSDPAHHRRLSGHVRQAEDRRQHDGRADRRHHCARSRPRRARSPTPRPRSRPAPPTCRSAPRSRPPAWKRPPPRWRRFPRR